MVAHEHDAHECDAREHGSHECDVHEHGVREHGAHEHDAREHGAHECRAYQRDGRERGSHECDVHEHGVREHGAHQHDAHECGAHEHGAHECGAGAAAFSLGVVVPSQPLLCLGETGLDADPTPVMVPGTRGISRDEFVLAGETDFSVSLGMWLPLSPHSPAHDRDLRVAAPLCKARVPYEGCIFSFLLLKRHFLQV